MKKACFAGSFDPFTKGHEDVIHRGLTLFDEIVIAVGINSSKTPFFAVENRLKHIASLFEGNQKITIKTFESELTVSFAQKNKCTHLLRGLRDSKDFSYEFPIGLMNRRIAGMETVYVLPDPNLIEINSTIVREIFKNGGKIDVFVTNADLLV
jgi:pantetheine-phosphate adenylyltransferase